MGCLRTASFFFIGCLTASKIGSSKHAHTDPDCTEMSDHLKAIASSVLEQGLANGTWNVIEDAEKLLRLAPEIRANH